MSGKVVGWAFDQRTGSATSKLVLVKLADNANEDGLCWPSVPTQAADTELGDRTIRKEIKSLVAQGLLEVEQRITNRGQVSNVYQLMVPWRRAKKGAPPPAPGSGGTLHRIQPPPAPGSGDALHTVQGHIEPSEEPSLNLAPSSAPPFAGRAGQLAKMFEPSVFAQWFQDSYFREGPPLTLVLATPARCTRARDKYGEKLRRTFGDELRFEFHRESIEAKDD